MPALAAPPAAAAVQRLARPGGSLAFDVTGDGPLVVCVPGMGDLRGTYRHLAPLLLGAGYRVATFDLRGHGDSDATFDAYGDEPAADDVIALLEQLGEPATIVGSSMGAAVAVLAAAARPELVRGIVLVGPFVRETPVPWHARLAFRAALGGPWAGAAFVSWMRRLQPVRPPADLDAHLAAVRAALRRPGHLAAFRRTAFAGHAASGAALADVRCPVLVVMGDRDPDFPDPAAEAALVADALHGTAVVVPEAGHYPHAERPDLVADVVLPFLAAHARG